MKVIKKISWLLLSFFIIGAMIYSLEAEAESKSEMIKRLRSKNCREDVGRTANHLTQLQQFHTDVTQLYEAMINAAIQPQATEQARQVDTSLTHLLAALNSHHLSKGLICERLHPMGDIQASEHPQGYEGLSKSERISRLKDDYCSDNAQNGAAIRKEIGMVIPQMERLLQNQAVANALKAPLDIVGNHWSGLAPILKEINAEQKMGDTLCQSMGSGISKSELIRLSKQGLEKGGQLPHFWYVITYD